jgi:hypothetical protein
VIEIAWLGTELLRRYTRAAVHSSRKEVEAVARNTDGSGSIASGSNTPPMTVRY